MVVLTIVPATVRRETKPLVSVRVPGTNIFTQIPGDMDAAPEFGIESLPGLVQIQ
jgi:hypothetical protein